MDPDPPILAQVDVVQVCPEDLLFGVPALQSEGHHWIVVDCSSETIRFG